MRRQTRFGRLLISAIAGLGLAGPAPAAAVPDPTVAGPLTVTSIEYDAGYTIVSDPQGISHPEQLRGRLSVPTGDGPFPVVLLMHGNHWTCKFNGVWGAMYPCPDTPATAEVPNHRGYEALAGALASHGYLVMSVNANGVNTFDIGEDNVGVVTRRRVGDKGGQARLELLARSLDLLRDWNEREGPGAVGGTLLGRVDLSRIGMMGHSRGGGAVSNFVEYNRTRSDGPRYPGLRAPRSPPPGEPRTVRDSAAFRGSDPHSSPSLSGRSAPWRA